MNSEETEKPDDAARKSPVERDFRRGNINFDFLQPEGRPTRGEQHLPGLDRRAGSREGKRGLFDRGRKQNPVGPLQIALWVFIFIAAVAGLVFTVGFGESLVWLLVFPLCLSALLWSIVMLALFKARPR